MVPSDEDMADDSATSPPSVWRDPSLRALVASRFVSMTGTQMTWVALPWFVLTTTGSPIKMTIVLFAEFVPFAVFGLTAGALVDRIDMKRLMEAADLVSMVVIATLPTLFALGKLQYWMIVAGSALIGAVNAPSMAAHKAIVPDIVGEDEGSLTAGNTAIQIAQQITTMTGPVLAGVLIGVLGNANLLFIDAGSYAISAVIVGFGVHVARPHPTPVPGHLIAQTMEGLRYLWNNRLLRVAVAYVVMLVFAFAGIIDAALPVFVHSTLHSGAGGLAVLLASWGLGSMAGMTVYGSLARRLPLSRGATVLALGAGLAAPMWIPPLTRALVPSAVAFFIAGASDGPLTIVLHTMQMTETTAEVRGRVIAAFQALFMLAAPLGVALAGPFLEAYGAVPWMFAMAAVFTAAALLAFASPTLRRA